MSSVHLALMSKGLTYVRNHFVAGADDVNISQLIAAEAESLEDEKLEGILLHVKKPAKNENNRIIARGKTTSEAFLRSAPYYRLLYVRCGSTMVVIIVKPGMGHVTLNLESDLRIGRAIVILNPTCSSHWNELPVVETPHPLLPSPNAAESPTEAIPHGQITRGPMRSFCIEVARLAVFRADFVTACSHDFCDGRYGTACPGGTTTGATVKIPRISFRVADVKAAWIPYSSKSLALQMFDAETLVNPIDSTLDFIHMERFVKQALNRHNGFRITGWFKPEVKDGDIVTETFKLHTSMLEITGGQLPRYQRPIDAVAEAPEVQ